MVVMGQLLASAVYPSKWHLIRIKNQMPNPRNDDWVTGGAPRIVSPRNPRQHREL